jgi:hypothetical protein
MFGGDLRTDASDPDHSGVEAEDDVTSGRRPWRNQWKANSPPFGFEIGRARVRVLRGTVTQ